MIKKGIVIKLNNSEFEANVETYRSTSEMLSDLKKRKCKPFGFDNMQFEKLDFNFHGVKKYKEALELLDKGFELATHEINKYINMNFNRYLPGKQKRFSFQNDVVGFQPIVPLVLQNIPNSMVNLNIKPIKSKVIDIYYDISCPWYRTNSNVLKAGQNIISYIYKLELQGYRVNIYSMDSFTDYSSGDFLCVKVKDSNLPLDIRRISFPIAHVAYSRVLAFDWYSKFPCSKYRVKYGKALRTGFNETECNKIVKAILGGNAVYVSGESLMENGESYLDEILPS